MALCIDVLVGCGFLLSLWQSQGESESNIPILFAFEFGHHYLNIWPTVTKFPRHWLFWQAKIGLFNERCVCAKQDDIDMDDTS
jgi:hypothetical protein